MTSRATVFSQADHLWMQGERPSVRKIITRIGGSARDVAPILRVWWHERTRETRSSADKDLQKLEEQFNAQRGYYMMEIDRARQETLAVKAQLAKAQSLIQYYRGILKDSAPQILPDAGEGGK